MRKAVLAWVVFHSILSVVDCCRKRIIWCHATLHVEDYVVGLRSNEPAESCQHHDIGEQIHFGRNSPEWGEGHLYVPPICSDYRHWL